MRRRLQAIAAVLALAGSSQVQPACAQPAKEPLVDQVREAINRGVQFLRDKQVVTADGKGHWEVDGTPAAAINRGGWTSLAMLALLNSGVKPNDPAIERGLRFLRELPPANDGRTYVIGLQTMVYALAGKNEDRERIQRHVDWLIQARIMSGGKLMGWTYGRSGAETSPDNSNTQYAMLGLHEGNQAGAKIDRAVWESIRRFYMDTQNQDGSWSYYPSSRQLRGREPSLTMTTAGLCGLIIAGLELNEGRERFQVDGSVGGCGEYKENEALTAALRWVGQRFRLEFPRGLYSATYYNMYGIERVGRLTGQRFLGDHDWYREGCELLVRTQSREGYWVGEDHDQWPVVSTSFALLFLSKGRTPVLVSKLVHGPSQDWNNDRHDVRNLVAYAGKEVFRNQPLAWQIFDGKRVEVSNRTRLLALVGDLLQSPIAYFNGHLAPDFTENEKELLKEYVEQGGFIFAEACCGRQEFDIGFRTLMKDLFPDSELKPLPPEHPIWHAHSLIKPGEFNLWGIERGCKTAVVYCPQDLSCLWEANQSKEGRGALAFRLGGNIIAYATGMELPKPRLSQVEVFNTADDAKRIPRGYLKVAQLRHEGDWQPAPQAMRNLMTNLRDKARLDVALQTEALHPSNPNVLDYKFMYMHGRGDFTYTERAIENLQSNLKTGGLLFADACCGRKAFDTSFRALVTRLFPDKKLEPIPLGDELYGKELNGDAIATVRCRRERPDGSGPDPAARDVPPFLEGIKIDNRWVVIYSKYDIGCALVKHQSIDCLGHDTPSALRVGSAVVLYALKR